MLLTLTSSVTGVARKSRQIAPDRAEIAPRSRRDRAEIAQIAQRSRRDRTDRTEFDPDFTSVYADMEARNAYRLGHRD